MWWKELEAVPGITNWQKFARKIQASFYIPEVRSRMFPPEGYSAPPTPQSLNRGAYLPDNLVYQDVRHHIANVSKAGQKSAICQGIPNSIPELRA